MLMGPKLLSLWSLFALAGDANGKFQAKYAITACLHWLAVLMEKFRAKTLLRVLRLFALAGSANEESSGQDTFMPFGPVCTAWQC